MAKRPTFFYVSPDFTYLELGDYHVSRYDFSDESAPIYLVHGETQDFAIVSHLTLHKLFRAADAIARETDDVMAMRLLAAFECECERLVSNATEEREAQAAAEDEREAEYVRDHEQGLRDQWRYI